MTAYLAQCASIRFDRARFDCVRFTADILHDITGTDLAAPFRDLYKTDEDAAALIASFGPLGLFGKVDEVFTGAGFTLMDWRRACVRGNPVLIDRSLGICSGPYALMPMEGGIGLTSIPMRAVKAVWDIPYA